MTVQSIEDSEQLVDGVFARLKRLVGNAILQYLHVEHTDEAIPTLDSVVEKAERLTRPVAFQSQRQLAQVQSQEIHVHAIDAVGFTRGQLDEIPSGLARPLPFVLSPTPVAGKAKWKFRVEHLTLNLTRR